MKVTNQTPEITVLNNGTDYTIDLGVMKKGTSKTATFLLEDVQYDSHSVSCGSCTKLYWSQQGKDLVVNITFSAIGMKGVINKSAALKTKNGEKAVFKLQGKII